MKTIKTNEKTNNTHRRKQKINRQLEKFFNTKNYTFNHLMVNNKAPFFGPSVEWHQEIYNVNTYAPGHKTKDWRNFLQTYIAIDRQDIHNGCLKVLKGSHKHGVQKNFDVINENLSHKTKHFIYKFKKIRKKMQFSRLHHGTWGCYSF